MATHDDAQLDLFVTRTLAEERKARFKDYQKRWRAENRAEIAAQKKGYYQANRERALVNGAKWRSQNKDKVTAAAAERYRQRKTEIDAQNIEWRKANRIKARAIHKAWELRNPEKKLANKAKGKAAVLRAIPAWADYKAIALVYREAVRMTKKTGKPHHVDHIVPLQSKWVCGLHCEGNLQIIPGKDNQSKGNRWWPDMGVLALISAR